jgi:hypothetical protein
VGVNPNPIMPGITDSGRSLDSVARDHGALNFGGGVLYLPGAAQEAFLPFLDREFPTSPPATARPSSIVSASATLTRMPSANASAASATAMDSPPAPSSIARNSGPGKQLDLFPLQ